jgi:FAD/FMN-containing dehydrogenase
MTVETQSWGRLAAPPQRVVSSEDWRKTAGRVLPFGNGRSYGDSCHLSGGTLIETRKRDRILSFDSQTGVMRCEPSVMLTQIVAAAAPHGFFIPVTPGTQFVTIAGAVANDVHGKNHHVRGTIGCHVGGLGLERSDAGEMHCSPESQPEMFSATVGGMGLTGLITYVDLVLCRVPSLRISETRRAFRHLSEFFALSAQHDDDYEFSVAWLDQLAKGKSFGRGVLMLGNFSAEGGHDATPAKPLMRVPLTPPISLLNRVSLTAFNALYYLRAGAPRENVSVPWDSFFYPLDRIGGWNRLYGPKGLMQHQSVVPMSGGEEKIATLLECAARHKQGSFLTVLKKFGDVKSPALLSFPRAGYTLTLDFPFLGNRTLRLLEDLDRIAIDAGGAVNPYKDARMSPETFAASFPNWAELERLRDPRFMSDFWLRTAMRL